MTSARSFRVPPRDHQIAARSLPRHGWPARLHVLMLAALLSACSPELHEGVFACAHDSVDLACPDGWTCRSDSLCYRLPALLTDATSPVTSADAGDVPDAQPPAPTEPEIPTCASASGLVVCNDQRFCNGDEFCDPANPRADARGCVAGVEVGCDQGLRCSERTRACAPCDDEGPNDADGDGHGAAACGGDDCDDGDPARHPGRTEECNGKDEDCDGEIDGSAADERCMAGAPPASTASCTHGTCAVTCADADDDYVPSSNSCVKHQDCPEQNPCGPGTCVDGSRAYTCMCPTGYASSGASSCADIDECATGTHDCSPHSTCTNSTGSFGCACVAGYTGSGRGASGCSAIPTPTPDPDPTPDPIPRPAPRPRPDLDPRPRPCTSFKNCPQIP